MSALRAGLAAASVAIVAATTLEVARSGGTPGDPAPMRRVEALSGGGYLMTSPRFAATSGNVEIEMRGASATVGTATPEMRRVVLTTRGPDATVVESETAHRDEARDLLVLEGSVVIRAHAARIATPSARLALDDGHMGGDAAVTAEVAGADVSAHGFRTFPGGIAFRGGVRTVLEGGVP